MCGRFALPIPRAALEELLGLVVPDAWEPRHNIAPGQEVLGLVAPAPVSVRLLRWGLVPPWAGKGTGPSLLVNVRAETAWGKPWLGGLARKHRCVLPALALYEWLKLPGGGSVPHALGRADGTILGLAGLWTEPADPAKNAACAVLTCAPNPLAARIHHRMPVLLAREDWAAWLDPADPEQSWTLAAPCPADGLAVWPVSSLVNAPMNDDPRCLAPVPLAVQGLLPLDVEQAGP